MWLSASIASTAAVSTNTKGSSTVEEKRYLRSSSSTSSAEVAIRDDRSLGSVEGALSYLTLTAIDTQHIIDSGASATISVTVSFDISFIESFNEEHGEALLKLCSFYSAHDDNDGGIQVSVDGSVESTSVLLPIQGRESSISIGESTKCRWNDYEVSHLLSTTLSLHQSVLSLHIKVLHTTEFASNEYEGGLFSPRLEVHFSSLHTDNTINRVSPRTRADNSNNNVQQVCTTIPNSDNNEVSAPQIIQKWIPGHSYQPEDTVSSFNVIYECKPYPYNGWCAEYEPGVGVWAEAWVVIGECVTGMVSSASQEVVSENSDANVNTDANSGSASNLNNNAASDLPPCPLQFSTEELYSPQDQVAANGRSFQCKDYPSSSWCSLGGYEPGSGAYWTMAWDEVGECTTDTTSEETPPASSTTLNAEPCAPLFTPGRKQREISFNSYNYLCKVPSWCSLQEYSPVRGDTVSSAAWLKSEERCEGVAETFPEETVELSPPVFEEAPASSSQEMSSVAEVVPSRPAIQHPPCSGLFTVGYEYSLKEQISFGNNNYSCELPESCSDVQYAPRFGNDNAGVAWWKIGPCSGDATRSPTPPPVGETIPVASPTTEDTLMNVLHDSYYIEFLPQKIMSVLESAKLKIEANVMVRQTPSFSWEPSSIYNYEGFIKALGVMTQHPIGEGIFFLGSMGGVRQATLYGLVNVAAFLSQAMAESIKYDSCDEANWDFVNSAYPLSNGEFCK